MYFDSLSVFNSSYSQDIDIFMDYVSQKHLDAKGEKFNTKSFAFEMIGGPQQTNLRDCGLFLIKVVDYVSRDAKIDFDPKDMPYYRKRLIWELCSQQILSP